MTTDHSDIENILVNLGYQLQKHSDHYRTSALYRDGDNKTALVIYPDANLCIDYVRGQKFSIKKLIALTLRLETKEEVEKWLDSKNYILTFKPPIPKIQQTKIYPNEILNELIRVHTYWNNRGISSDVLERFQGGITGNKGKLKNRYVFPIFDEKARIVGFTGRDTLKNGAYYGRPPWKHMGNKKEWIWPLQLSREEIVKKKEIILVESPGCVLSLFEAGIYNCLCLFGVELYNPLLNFLIKHDVDSIIISTNNDALNNKTAGNKAAEKIKGILKNYFDSHQIKVSLPTERKDWNEVLQLNDGKQMIKDWYNDCR